MCQRFCSIPSNLVSSDRKDDYKHHLPTSAVGSMFPEILTSSNRAKICDSLHKIAEKVMNIPPTAHNKKPLQKYLNTKSSSNSKRIIHIHRQHQEHCCAKWQLQRTPVQQVYFSKIISLQLTCLSSAATSYHHQFLLSIGSHASMPLGNFQLKKAPTAELFSITDH